MYFESSIIRIVFSQIFSLGLKYSLLHAIFVKEKLEVVRLSLNTKKGCITKQVNYARCVSCGNLGLY